MQSVPGFSAVPLPVMICDTVAMDSIAHRVDVTAPPTVPATPRSESGIRPPAKTICGMMTRMASSMARSSVGATDDTSSPHIMPPNTMKMMVTSSWR